MANVRVQMNASKKRKNFLGDNTNNIKTKTLLRNSYLGLDDTIGRW